MQPVETSHDLQVGRRHRTSQVVDTATADAQNFTSLASSPTLMTPKGSLSPT